MTTTLRPESPWVGEHRRPRGTPSASLREKLGLSRANLLVIKGFTWLWIAVEVIAVFGPFVY